MVAGNVQRGGTERRTYVADSTTRSLAEGRAQMIVF
jgi:hypothetical protein